jgi:hypothetical protein
MPTDSRNDERAGDARTPPPRGAEETRQGVVSGRVLTVLAISLSLAVITLVIAYFVVV